MRVLHGPWLGLLAVAWCLVGCPSSPQPESCLSRPESCATYAAAWPIATDCSRTDALEVDIGQGEAAFAPLTSGEKLVIHAASGGGQGSSVQHVWAALRVRNPEANHAKFRAQFQIYDGSSGEFNIRVFVLSKSMVTAPDGSASRSGLQLFIQAPLRRITLDVTDECGRKGHAEQIPAQ